MIEQLVIFPSWISDTESNELMVFQYAKRKIVRWKFQKVVSLPHNQFRTVQSILLYFKLYSWKNVLLSKQGSIE